MGFIEMNFKGFFSRVINHQGLLQFAPKVLCWQDLSVCVCGGGGGGGGSRFLGFHILNIYGFRRFSFQLSIIHVAILIPGRCLVMTAGA